jgi:hypothetical protein
MYTIFSDSLKYCESISLKQCRHPQTTFLLSPDKLRAARESLIVKQNGFQLKVLMLVLIPDLHSVVVPQLLQIFNQRPKISVDVILRLLWPRYQPDIIIYFLLLHNQGVRFKIVSTIAHVPCVLLFMNGFMPSMLIVILIFLGSMTNLGFRESMFHHCVASS